jgi:hypothetical protein
VLALTEAIFAQALATIETPSGAPAGGTRTLTQQHELIRDADEYGDLFAHAAAVTPRAARHATEHHHTTQRRRSAMNMIEIERALRELRLSGIAETLSTRVMQAQAAQEPFLETFAAMLQDELDRRRSRLTERRFKRSGLDERPRWPTSTGVSTRSCRAAPASSCTP